MSLNELLLCPSGKCHHRYDQCGTSRANYMSSLGCTNISKDESYTWHLRFIDSKCNIWKVLLLSSSSACKNHVCTGFLTSRTWHNHTLHVPHLCNEPPSISFYLLPHDRTDTIYYKYLCLRFHAYSCYLQYIMLKLLEYALYVTIHGHLLYGMSST